MISTHQTTIDGLPQVYHVAGTGPVCVVHPGGPGIGWGYLRLPALEEHLTMVYLEPIGTGDSGRLPQARDYHLGTYLRFLEGVIEHLGQEVAHVGQEVAHVGRGVPHVGQEVAHVGREVPHVGREVAHVGQEKVFLLGHSHGGFVVQRYALAHPDRVAGLVLYDTSPVTGEEFWAGAMEGVAAYPSEHPDEPAAGDVPKGFQEALQAADDAALTAAFARFIPLYLHDYWERREEFAPFVAGIRAWADPQRGAEPEPFDVRSRLGEISAPVLIVVGRHDFICGVRWARMLHEGISGSRLVVLDGSGHMGHIEQADEFYRAVGKFLGR
jgi:pimeloyl-ACP methyl ester carboxylesterase